MKKTITKAVLILSLFIVTNKTFSYNFGGGGGTFVQQGNKKVGTNAIGSQVFQGFSVAISADGNTAITGGPEDNNGVGAVWIYTRTGSTWTQQTQIAAPNDAIGTAEFGFSVGISANGNTIIVGAMQDDSYTGAAWIYTRSGNNWTEVQKLIGTGASGNARQGYSAAISGDGLTAIVGGNADNSNI